MYREKLGGLYRVVHNLALDLRTRRDILMAVVQPSLKYDCEVWNSNKCQAKALDSIQLCVYKYVLGCSVTTWVEPVHTDLGLKTIRNRKDFRKPKWYCKVMSLNHERLPFKIIINECDKIKCKGNLENLGLPR